jgi:integrase
MTKQSPNKKWLSGFLLRALKPKPKPYLVWDSLQRGLAIQVRPTGHKSWYVIYTRNGRPRWFKISDVNSIGLAKARELAADVMYDVAKGKDPAAERAASRTAGTFEELVERYRRYSEKKNKSWRQADALVRKRLLPRWAKLKASDISRSDVKQVIGRIEAPITANQVLASASAIFTFAIREEIGGIKINPCVGVERNKTSSRERVLSDAEIPKVWRALDSVGPVEAMALRTILLCGQRPGEVSSMRSEHIDEDGWWTLPGKPVPELRWPGTKNAQSHRVWLSSPVRGIIEQMEATGFIFAGPRGRAINNIDVAMRSVCSELGIERATPHDLRRTFSTTVTMLGFGKDAMNRVTNHKEGGISSVYDMYEYAEENRKVMEAVAGRVTGLVQPGPGNVIPMKPLKSLG